MRPRTRLAALAASGALLAGSFAAATPATAATTSCTVVAAGDVAGSDDTSKAVATRDLIEKRDPAKVFVLGDIDYDSTGSLSYYRKAWGPLLPDTEALRGNHDTTAGMTGYFGADSVRNRAVSVCGWRVLLVNQYGTDAVSKGAAFIAAERKAHPDAELAVAWHEPWRSSGGEHGTTARANVAPLWKAATAAHARIVLGAHDHHGEVFKPMDASGNAVASGAQLIISGKAGHHPRDTTTVRANSIARVQGSIGAPLFLTLAEDGAYSWSFISPGGTDGQGVVRASGSRAADSSTPAPGPSTSSPSPSSSPSSSPSPSSTSGGTPLSYSGRSDRAGAVVLDPSKELAVSGLAYFFTPTTATTKTTFKVDGGTVITESRRPFDAKGTADDGTAKPLDTTKLSNGKHTITANSVSPDRAATTYSFTVQN